MIWTALVLGIVGSTHCLGMCGPLALALPLSSQDRWKLFWESLYYNLGRVLTYTFLGFLFGWIGQGIALAGFQKNLTIALGVVLLLMAFFSFNLEKGFLKIKPIRVFYDWHKKQLGRILNQSGLKALLGVGILNGFLPCGLVYLALAGAVSVGSVIDGMIFMAAFGLGTLPLMLSLLWLGNTLGRPLKQKLSKVGPYIMAGFAILLIFRGFSIELPTEFRFWAESPTLICH